MSAGRLQIEDIGMLAALLERAVREASIAHENTKQADLRIAQLEKEIVALKNTEGGVI